MQNRVETGRAYSFYRDSLTGLSIATIYTRYDSERHRHGPSDLAQHERDNFGKKEDYGTLFTDKEAWDVTFRGARPLPADRFTALQRQPRCATSSISFASACTSPAGSSNPRAPT